MYEYMSSSYFSNPFTNAFYVMMNTFQCHSKVSQVSCIVSGNWENIIFGKCTVAIIDTCTKYQVMSVPNKSESAYIPPASERDFLGYHEPLHLGLGLASQRADWQI